MFTGIIQEKGEVLVFTRKRDVSRLTVESDLVFKNVRKGDSISVSGVCLTAVEIGKRTLFFDVVRQTQEISTLRDLAAGDPVNLERSLTIGDPLGGHFVTGHIDCVGTVAAVNRQKETAAFEISVEPQHIKFLAKKGSVAVDGISLTVGEIGTGSFTVYLIPHTLSETTMDKKRPGDRVNIEFDMIGKYVLNAMEKSGQTGITEDFLRRKGYI